MGFVVAGVLVHALDAEHALLGLAEEHEVLVVVAAFCGVLFGGWGFALAVVLAPGVVAQLAAVLFAVERDLRGFGLFALGCEVVEALRVAHLF